MSREPPKWQIWMLASSKSTCHFGVDPFPTNFFLTSVLAISGPCFLYDMDTHHCFTGSHAEADFK